MRLPFKKYKLNSLKLEINREELKRMGRILIIDDEKPDTLLEPLMKNGFSVDYYEDIIPDNLYVVEEPRYDLILLDYGNVGSKIGNDEGYSILGRIKQVNVYTAVYAYTSRSLNARQSDFYTKADGTLSKDAGIGETIQFLEEGLKNVLNIGNCWRSFLKSQNIEENSKRDFELQNSYVKGVLRKENMDKFRNNYKFNNMDVSKNITLLILEKLLELGIKAVII